jgi:hypothetical protein
LRVLCIVALDTIRVLRGSRPLSRKRREDLAVFLDFQACTNAVWDRKPVCAADYQVLRQRLEEAGLGAWATEYLHRIRELEARRPPAGGDRWRFADVRSYREAVVRVSLAANAAIALNAECLDEAIRTVRCDGNVAALYRMAMQCQIIDDVVDYRKDVAAALPSFLTASASRPESLALTAEAVRFYGETRGHPAGTGVFPLEVALSVVTALAKLALALARSGEAVRPTVNPS